MNSLKFKIHNIVKIKDIGSIYPTYSVMAEKLGADIGDKWVNQRLGNGITGKKAEILNFQQEASNCHILIEMIEGSHFGEQYVIGKSGIKSIEVNILDDDMFEI